MNNIENFSEDDLREKIRTLRIRHRELDVYIVDLENDMLACALNIRRLKKEKLMIRDTLTKLESLLIPNLNA